MAVPKLVAPSAESILTSMMYDEAFDELLVTLTLASPHFRSGFGAHESNSRSSTSSLTPTAVVSWLLLLESPPLPVSLFVALSDDDPNDANTATVAMHSTAARLDLVMILLPWAVDPMCRYVNNMYIRHNHDEPEAAGEVLLHPVIVGAVGVLLLNDKVLKPHVPGVVTGKLSDFAGLVFFPVLAVALAELIRRRPASRRAFIAAAVGAALAFSAIKLSPTAADAYRAGLGWLRWAVSAPLRILTSDTIGQPRNVSHVEDPTDLLALPSVLVAVWLGQRRATPPAIDGQ